VLAWGYAVRRGRIHASAKARSYWAVLRLLPVVRRGRRQAQAARRVEDRVLLTRLQGRLPISALLADARVPPTPLAMLDRAFASYLEVLRRVVRW
jgi:hypothetical protein